jgi:hypothetical protein
VRHSAIFPIHQFAPLPGIPEIPADDAGIDALRSFLSAVDAFAAGLTDEQLSSLSAAEAEALDALADARDRAQSAITAEDGAAQRGASALARLRPPAADPAPADEPAPADAATEPAPAADPAAGEPGQDPIAAGGASGAGLPPLPTTRPRMPRLDASQVPEAIRPEVSITAGADLRNWHAGSPMESMREVAEAFIERRGLINHVPEGLADKIPVATLSANMPAERRLTAQAGPMGNQAIVEGITSRQALAASGGICAPLEPYYDIMVLAGAQRPVRGALPTFEAERGGIQLVPPPTLASVGPQARTVSDAATTNTSATVSSATARFVNYDIGATITGAGIPASTVIIAVSSDQQSCTLSANATATATGVSITITRPGSTSYITAAQDALGLTGTAGQVASSLKPCLHVTCPAPQSYTIAAVTRCLEVGNFSARTYPEQVTAWLELVMSYQARLAETQLLNQLSSNSTQITQAQVLGASRDIIPTVIKMASYYRQHNRMDPDAPLRWMGPAWLLDAMAADLIRGSVYDADYWYQARNAVKAAVIDALAVAGIAAEFYQDSGTGKGQYFNSGNAQSAGAATTFPSTAVHYLFAEGSFLYLDGGTLDLGIVRDSTLNAQNNYRIFAETFEILAYVGVESLEITSTIAVNGAGVIPISATAGI